MAQMRPSIFPNSREEHQCDKEDEVFDLLASNLPDDAIIVYEPQIYNKKHRNFKPDFVIFWEKIGIVILEVKNWCLDNIVSGNEFYLTVSNGNGDSHNRPNPYRKALSYMYPLWDHIEMRSGDSDRFFRDDRGIRKFGIVITPIVLFMSTRENELENLASKLGNISPSELFSEEALRNKKLLISRLKNLPFRFQKFGDYDTLKMAAGFLRADDEKIKSSAAIKHSLDSTKSAKRAPDEKPAKIIKKPQRKDQTNVEFQKQPSLGNTLKAIRNRFLPPPDGKDSPLASYKRLCKVLRESAAAVSRMIKEGDPEHQSLGKLDRLISDVKNDRFTIGLFGTTGAGKSTLCNALVGDTLLQENKGETTRMVNRICSPDADHPDGTALVRHKTFDTIKCEIEGLLKEYRIDAALPGTEGFDSIIEKIKESIREFSDSQSTDSEYLYAKALTEGWPEYSDKLGSELRLSREASDQMIQAEHQAVFIDERILFHDNPITRQGLTFIDTPGVGSSFKRHTDEAVRLARMVDAAVMVTRVDYKFMPPDREFLRDALDVQRNLDCHNFMFVLNQIHRINPTQYGKKHDQLDECIQGESNKLKKSLQKFGFKNFRIHALDAACGRWSRKVWENPDDIMTHDQLRQYAMVDRGQPKPDPFKNFEVSQLDDFEKDLITHLTKHRYHFFLGKKLDRLEAAVINYHQSVQKTIDSRETELSQLYDEQKKHKLSQKHAYKALDQFFHAIPGEMEGKYGDINLKVSQLVERAFQVLAEKYAQLYQNKEVDRRNLVSLAIEAAGDDIREQIQITRDEYELQYNRFKDNAISMRIPEIIAEYTDTTDWKLTRTDITDEIADRIRGFERIDLSIWQKLVIQLSGFLGHKTPKEKIMKSLRANFETNLAEQFKKDIIGWVQADRAGFRNQVEEAFNSLMTQIGQNIEDRITMREGKKKERVEWLNRLAYFKNQSAEALDNLKHLRKEVEKARPS